MKKISQQELNERIKYYLSNGRYSPNKSEKRKLELQRKREIAQRAKNPLHSNSRVEDIYKDTVNQIYLMMPEEA